MSSSLDFVFATIGQLNVSARAVTIRDRCSRSPVQIKSRRRWLITAATAWAILTSGGGVTAQTASNPLFTGGTSKSISCVSRYRKVAWSAPIPASDLGKSLLASDFYKKWNPQGGGGQDHIDIAKAPDGTSSMRVHFTPEYGYYGFKGKTFAAKPLQTACFSFKLWIATNYWTGYRANQFGHLRHAMPRLWGGPRWYQPPCSLRSQALATGSGFDVATTMRNNGTISIGYHDYANLKLNACGQDTMIGGAPMPATGRWHRYDLEVVMNNNASRTGIGRLYANGAFATETTSAAWEPLGKNWGVMGPWVENGGGNTPDRIDTSWWYYKDFVVYTND
jgi:hypothetical protein